MIIINPKYIKDAEGNSLVVLSQKEYDQILEELDELEDIRLYDEAKKGPLEFIDAKQAFDEIEKNR